MTTTVETSPVTHESAERLRPGHLIYLFPDDSAVGTVWVVKDVSPSTLGVNLTIEHFISPTPHALFVRDREDGANSYPLTRCDDDPSPNFFQVHLPDPGGEEQRVETFWGSTLSLTALVPDQTNHALVRARVEALLRSEFPDLFLPEITSATLSDERVDVYADPQHTQLLARNVLKATMHYLPFATRDVYCTRPFAVPTPDTDSPDQQHLLDALAAEAHGSD